MTVESGLIKFNPLENEIKSSLGVEIPYWHWKSEILQFNKKEVIPFLLKKEKQLINKFPSAGDGSTQLPFSLTSRYEYYNFLSIKSTILESIQKHIIDNIKMCINTFNTKEGKNISTDDLWIICWYNVLRKNENISKHAHRSLGELHKTFFSGHLTIQAENTNTYYLSLCNKYSWIGENIEGQVTIFPSYMPHYTDVTISKSPRISIAFDVFDKRQIADKVFVDRSTCIHLKI